jgi:hypothetical protein
MTEIEVAIFATGLMLVRLVSMYLVMAVALKQLKIWRKVKQLGVREKAHVFRILLFALAVVMLLKNIIPLVIDIVAATSLGDMSLEFGSLSDSLIVHYFTSNAIFDLITGGIIWLLYREAGRYT